MPIKTNKINKTTGKKVRPYLEYRYVNIKASQTPELLEQVNAYWEKRLDAINEGLERMQQRLEAIAQATSTPEGQKKFKLEQDAGLTLMSLEETYLIKKDSDRSISSIRKESDAQIDKMVSELKQEGRLPEQYKTDHDYIRKILKTDIVNREAVENLLSSGELSSIDADADVDDYIKSCQQLDKQARKLMKDAIEAYCNKKEVEKQPVTKAKQYDWEALDYR
jgi:hypothetical protein